MTARLNIRIDAALARKVAYLRSRTRSRTTDVVKAAIEAYHDRVRASEQAAVLFADFVGCDSSEPQLSTCYKRLLSRAPGR